MTAYAPLFIIAGDTFSRTLAVTTPEGAAQSLAGATLTFRLRAPGAAQDAVTRALTVGEPPDAGRATLVLAPGETAALDPAMRYEYEVEAVIGGATTTLVAGTAAVQADWR